MIFSKYDFRLFFIRVVFLKRTTKYLCVYNVCVSKITEQLTLSSSHPTITCNTWCDEYKYRSYIYFTIHYFDSNLKLYQHRLKTELFDEPHTGEAIKDLFLIVVNEFNLNPNNIIVVSKIYVKVL